MGDQLFKDADRNGDGWFSLIPTRLSPVSTLRPPARAPPAPCLARLLVGWHRFGRSTPPPHSRHLGTIWLPYFVVHWCQFAQANWTMTSLHVSSYRRNHLTMPLRIHRAVGVACCWVV